MRHAHVQETLPAYVDPFDRICLGLELFYQLATTDLGGAALVYHAADNRAV